VFKYYNKKKWCIWFSLLRGESVEACLSFGLIPFDGSFVMITFCNVWRGVWPCNVLFTDSCDINVSSDFGSGGFGESMTFHGWFLRLGKIHLYVLYRKELVIIMQSLFRWTMFCAASGGDKLFFIIQDLSTNWNWVSL